MAYFLDYEMFTPCWYCGRTDCTGNHQGAAAEAFSRRLTHACKGFGHDSCPCHICESMRVRETNRETQERH